MASFSTMRLVVFALCAVAAVDACTQAAAGKLASATGCPVVNYNEDWDGFQQTEINPTDMQVVTALKDAALPGVVAQFVPGYSVCAVDMGSTVGERFCMGGINAKGFVADFGTYVRYTTSVARADPWVGTGMADDFWKIIHAFSGSVSEAVALVDAMAAGPGLSDWMQGSIIMADTEHVLIGYFLGGHTWAACIIPDNATLVNPNSIRLTGLTVSVSSGAGVGRCHTTPNFASWIAASGVTSSISSTNPDVMTVDLSSALDRSYYNNDQITRTMQVYLELTGSARPAKRDPVDSSVVVKAGSVNLQKLRSAQRSDLSSVMPELDISHTGPRHIPGEIGTPICRTWTNYGAIYMPGKSIVDNRMWISFGSPCLSVYVPLWVAVGETPELLHAGASLFKTMRSIQLNVDRAYNPLDLGTCQGPTNYCDDGAWYTRRYGFLNETYFSHATGWANGVQCNANDYYTHEQIHVVCAGKELCDGPAGVTLPSCCAWCHAEGQCNSHPLIEAMVDGTARRVVAENFAVGTLKNIQTTVDTIASTAERSARIALNRGDASGAIALLRDASKTAVKTVRDSSVTLLSELENIVGTY